MSLGLLTERLRLVLAWPFLLVGSPILLLARKIGGQGIENALAETFGREQMAQEKYKKQGFVMDGPKTFAANSSRLPVISIPTEDFNNDLHAVYRHLPRIREGKLDIRHGKKPEVENG